MSTISPLTFQHTKQSLSGFKMAAGLGAGFLALVSELKTLEAYISVLQAVCTLLMNTSPTYKAQLSLFLWPQNYAETVNAMALTIKLLIGKWIGSLLSYLPIYGHVPCLLLYCCSST